VVRRALFAAAGPGVVKVRLTAGGRKLLKDAKRIRLEAKGCFRQSSGWLLLPSLSGFGSKHMN
jgi:hypothetical protein